MKHIILSASMVLMSLVLFAGEKNYVRVLRNYETGDTLAVFSRIEDNPLHLTTQAELQYETNRVEIVERVNNDVLAWYGLNWENYSSSKSDDNGYCWWTCPEFDETNQVTGTIVSGSGENNHIGLIIPQGTYSFTFDARVGSDNLFILERIPSTSLKEPSVVQPADKLLINGQMIIVRDGKKYTLQGVCIQ